VAAKNSAKSKKGKGKDRSKSPKSGVSKDNKKDKSSSPKGSARKKSSSPKSGKGKKGKAKSKSPTPVPAQSLEEKPTGEPESPQPGADDYVYVNEKIEEKMAKIVSDYWDNIEVSYINGSKFVFRKIRIEREQIIRYFFTIKSNFLDYLKRPDTKQIELESFIKVENVFFNKTLNIILCKVILNRIIFEKEYNSIPDDIRDDEEVKAELHQRVEDLKENLWRICDVKKQEAEKERDVVMSNGWLSDKIGFLINHYITLIQVNLILK
jgi:hypothetical protein